MGAARNQEASAKTERTLASTHCFSLSVMMPASRRQLALKDMKEAEGASLIGKISSRFTGDSMALSALIGPFFSLGTDWGAAGTMSPTGSSCHLYFGAEHRQCVSCSPSAASRSGPTSPAAGRVGSEMLTGIGEGKATLGRVSWRKIRAEHEREDGEHGWPRSC